MKLGMRERVLCLVALPFCVLGTPWAGWELGSALYGEFAGGLFALVGAFIGIMGPMAIRDYGASVADWVTAGREVDRRRLIASGRREVSAGQLSEVER